MAMSQSPSQGQASLVEEKYFDLSLGESGSLIKEALEEASGMQLEQLAPGMWSGSREVGRGVALELTARAQAVEEGTSIEIRVEHRTSPAAMALGIFLIIAGATLLLPLIPIIMWAQKAQKRQQRERLVLMHQLWTELGAVVGAPRRGSYRNAPERAYAGRSRIEAAAEPARVTTAPSPEATAQAEHEAVDEAPARIGRA